MRNLNRQLIYSAVILDLGEVVVKDGGMPSGDLRTISINSIANWIKNIYIFLKMMGKHVVGALEMPMLVDRIFTSIRMHITGDDDLGSVNTRIFEWFNPAVVTDSVAELGLKLKVFEVKKKLEELEYLSARFHHQDGRVVQLMNREKMACQAVYGHQNKDPRLRLVRLYALKHNAWPDRQLFSALSEAAASYRRDHANDINAGNDNVIPLIAVAGQDLSSQELRELHLGADEAGRRFKDGFQG